MRKALIGFFLGLGIAAAFSQEGQQVRANIAATTCTNQFVRSIAAATGAGTCATVANADLANSSITVGGATCTLGSSCSPGVISQVVNNTFDLTTATGAVQNNSFSFTPSTCSGMGAINNGLLTSYVTFNSHSDSAASQYSLFGQGASQTGISTVGFFRAVDATGSNLQTGVISYSANTATITWSKTGTPTGTFSYSIRCLK